MIDNITGLINKRCCIIRFTVHLEVVVITEILVLNGTRFLSKTITMVHCKSHGTEEALDAEKCFKI